MELQISIYSCCGISMLETKWILGHAKFQITHMRCFSSPPTLTYPPLIGTSLIPIASHADPADQVNSACHVTAYTALSMPL